VKKSTTCQHKDQPHDPLEPHELNMFRDVLAHLPLDGKVSVFDVCRLMATLDAELGIELVDEVDF
jgi:hypothetical protein